MTVFTIQSPDGRKIKVEAADQATALRGAQEWAKTHQAQKAMATAPTGLKPGSREYANWAAQEARAGKALPQVSTPQPEWAPPTAKSKYEQSLGNIRRTYYPELTDEQWQRSVDAKGFLGESLTNLKPHDAGGLLNDGLTMGLSDEARGAAGAASAFFSGKDPGKAFQDYQGFEQARRAYGAETGGALGTAAQIGGSVLAGRPDMAATRVVGLLPSIIQGGRQAAQQGAIYGAASTEGDLVDRARGAALGGATGAVFGAGIPALVGGVKKVISPFGGSVTKRPAANVLAREGVELTAGQATGSQNLRYREAELGGVAAENFMERQADQFTAAALRRVGVNAPRATHDVIDNAFGTIGQQFDDLATRNGLQADLRLSQDMNRIWTRFDNITNESTRPRYLERLIHDIRQRGFANGYGLMDGEWFKATRSDLSEISRNSGNQELAEAARDLMHALDDAMERGLRQNNPADLGGWQEARRLYRNMIVIQDSATRAGAASAEGIITPQALRSAAMKQNKRSFARGRNEFVDLADAGVSAMTPLPNSGTPGRLGAKILMPAGAIAGAGLGAPLGPIGAAVGAGVGVVAPWATGRAMLSGAGRRYLGNQVAGPVTSTAAKFGALLGRGAQPLLPSKGR